MKHHTIVYLTALSFGLFGCTSARLKKFEAFSAAGVTQSETARGMYREAGNLAVDTDTYTLLKTREKISDPGNRREEIIESDKEIRERIKILSDLSRHSALLGDYFAGLNALATSESPAKSGEQLTSIVTQIQEIGASISQSSVGNQKVADFIGGVATIVLKQYQVEALNRELAARGSTIERELELQSAALKAVMAQMEEDADLLGKGRESVDVVDPFAATGNLPKTWIETRRDVLTGGRSIEAAGLAVNASEKLKQAYLNLLSDELSLGDLQLIMKDLESAIAILKTLKA